MDDITIYARQTGRRTARKARAEIAPGGPPRKRGSSVSASAATLAMLMDAERVQDEFESAKRGLTAQIISAQEKERKRISSELHDSIGSTLSAIKFYLENAVWQMNDHNVDQSAYMFRNVIPQIQYAIDEVRRISMDLRPPLLDDIGALAALTWFIREHQAIYEHIRIDLLLDIREDDIPAILKVEIFRIVQEAMNNCAKYSRADCACVSLINTGSDITLAITDNGQGFDPSQVYSPKNVGGGGMGLASMRERAELSGGMFSIESSQGACTKVQVVWPFREVRG